VRASHSSRPIERCKGRSAAPVQNRSHDVSPPRRFIPLTPAERARRIDALRTALVGTALLFQARVRRGEEGSRP